MKNESSTCAAARAILQSGKIFNRQATQAERDAARRLVDSRPYWARLAEMHENT